MKFGMFICWSFSTFSGQEWTPTLDKDASYFKVSACDTDQWCRTAKDAEGSYEGYLTAEFTYPILPAHEGGAMWFYSLPRHDGLCREPEQLYEDYLGAVKYENIFSLDVAPNYYGKLRDIDVKTLTSLGEMIRSGEDLNQ